MLRLQASLFKTPKTMFRSLTIFLLALGLALLAQAQDAQILVKYTDVSIQIDGQLNESAWARAGSVSELWMHTPRDSAAATERTEFKVLFDDQFLYISATCFFRREPIIQSLKRDNRLGSSDGIEIVLDPLNQQTNAFLFALNAGGAQTEGLISLGELDLNWDNKWYSAVKNYGDHWVAELAIPFQTLRFKDNNPVWGINFIRDDPSNNEIDTWRRVPLQFDAWELGYLQEMFWERPPLRAKSTVSLIPYLAANADKVGAANKTTTGIDGGLDGKVLVSPGLNLDVTLNPDFSQVEVDQQVSNLTRFSVFFPERRTFFLENADIFGSFGNSTALPFFSRRLGLSDSGTPVPISYGLRLSGNLDERSRIGLMNIQTNPVDRQVSQNFTAASFQRKVLKRSVIKGLLLSRQGIQDSEWRATDFGRNAGLEMDYVSQDGRWSANLGYNQSFKHNISKEAAAVTGRLNFGGRNFRTILFGGHVGNNYYADMGFVPQVSNYDAERDTIIRLGYTRFYNSLDYFVLPSNNERINQHWFGLENNVVFNNGIGLTDWYTRLRYFMVFQNTAQLRFRINNNYVDLQFPFSFTGDTPLPAQVYDNIEFNIEYNSDARKTFSTTLFAVYGSFYAGNKFTYRAGLNYRRQPWGNFSLQFEQNFLDFDDPYGYETLTLLGARLEFSFTNNLFWTNFLQYNTQANNFNINSRFQWRFAPMSDFFLVYTDNYLIEPNFGPKTRSLVAKLTYWLNL